MRLALAVGFLAAALIAGLALRTALASLVLGGVVTALLLLGRSSRGRARLRDSRPAPPGSRVEPWWETGLRALLPSTAGLAAFGAVALFSNETLAALIAGILTGMGVVALVSGLEVLLRERRERVRIYVSRGRRADVLTRPRERSL